jgi:hypothetical protein
MRSDHRAADIMHRLRYSAAALLASVAAHAHHSISSVYDGARQVTLEGVVRDFQFVNPHPLIVVQIVASGDSRVDGAGAGELWTLEMDNRWELAELGFAEDTLEPGDRIVVTGSLGRRQPQTLYVRKLDRADDDFSYEHHR